jgi:D-alanyl-D-alanine carboxypeptidase/D-alanyl-D-alanine-endopeptidase (penicillin-binding protein 4)
MTQEMVKFKNNLPFILFMVLFLMGQPSQGEAGQPVFNLSSLSPKDAVLVAGPDGRILYKKNEAKKCVPASTFKVLTALAALHHLGPSYRFETRFFQDASGNLKVKGFGDPLLISEVFPALAEALASRISECQDIIVDDSFFVPDLKAPGVVFSTNPYDAPNGALCANFNTIFFTKDDQGSVISAEPQTPMLPFAVQKIKSLGEKKGRYTFTHNGHEGALYAGELLRYFLGQKGRGCRGVVRSGTVLPDDRLVYIFQSPFTLDQAVGRLLEFSNNFIANQIFVTLGAEVYGPPGDFEKGVRAAARFAEENLKLKNLDIEEGSGISRGNKISALDMLTLLRAFEPHRNLMTRKGSVLYKTGSLSGIRTRVGYIEHKEDRYYFIIFLQGDRDTEHVLKQILKGIEPL